MASTSKSFTWWSRAITYVQAAFNLHAAALAAHKTKKTNPLPENASTEAPQKLRVPETPTRQADAWNDDVSSASSFQVSARVAICL